ncbi:MAG TPA: tetratricopeptide repeat protein [Planctomycetota bacterium]|nr:tetratricopeptide repeat protein [Planctomycetota bacterium]
MGRIVLAAILALSLSPQEIKWKTNWPEALKEAKASKKLAILVFFNKGIKDCQRFEAETLPNAAVISALQQHVCARIDPDGTDEENALWQKHGQERPPMTYVYDPDGKLLTTVSALKPEYYAGAIAQAGPAYFNKILPAREALARDPNQADKLAMLGEAYEKLNNPVESQKAYAAAVDALQKKGDKAGALRLLEAQLGSYYDMKWYVPARAACLKVAELDPADASKLGAKAAWIIGMADCKESKWQNAITGMKAACDRFKDAPNMDQMLFTLGSAYMYARDKDNAIAVFEEIVKKYPNSETRNIAQLQIDKLRK